MGFPHHLLTFEKGICCKGKERQLKHKLAKQEGLKPRWGALEQSVFELLGIPLAQVSQLGKDGDRDECSHLAGQARQLQPTGRAPQYPAPLASGTPPRWLLRCSLDTNSLALTQVFVLLSSSSLCATKHLPVTQR